MIFYLDNYLADLGYQELNWNLGCPYPMVTKRKLGAGMLEHPDLIRELLEQVVPKLKCKLSIKMRTGNLDESEIQNIIPVLNDFPFTEIIVHPRIAKQLYKGKANIDIFAEISDKTSHKLAYNGDIDSVEKFQFLEEKFPNVEHWMIGRKLIANPFLAADIKGITICKPSERLELFKEFHDQLYVFYFNKLNGSGHLLSKMLHLWEYFSTSFSNSHKVFKRIKKAKTIERYNAAVAEIFRSEEWEA